MNKLFKIPRLKPHTMTTNTTCFSFEKVVLLYHVKCMKYSCRKPTLFRDYLVKYYNILWENFFTKQQHVCLSSEMLRLASLSKTATL